MQGSLFLLIAVLDAVHGCSPSPGTWHDASSNSGRMRVRVAIYAAAMLLTGTINTVSTKYQDMSVVGIKKDGTPILFLHPAFQSACMFLGEALCLIPYFLLRWRRRAIKASQGIVTKPRSPPSFYIKRTLAFAIPTLCDATGTTLLNIGLFYTFASIYQMLRGTLVLFTGFFTIMILKRRLYLHHWLGMTLIAAGAAIVGAASMLSPACPPPDPASPAAAPAMLDVDGMLMDAATRQLLGDSQGGYPAGEGGSFLSGAMSLHWPGLFTTWWGAAPQADGAAVQGAVQHGSMCSGSKGLPPEAAKALFGNGMVVLAQAFTAFQFILEEKWLAKYRMQPLLAVGIEGAWGVLLCAALLPVLNMIHTPEGIPIDDAAAAFRAMVEVPMLRYAVIGSILSIGAFNFFGLSVTQALSGASRATIDACRTLLVWAVSIAAGWEAFRQLQVVGFVVLLSGTSLYNELIRSCLPGVPQLRPSMSGDLSDEEGEGQEGAEGQYQADDSAKSGWPGGGHREGNDLEEALLSEVDAEQGLTGAPAAMQRGAAGPGRHSQSQRITGQGGPHQGRAHHHHHHTTMARSMRLGYNALSPHDLASDEESQEEGPAEDVIDPMMLAATPVWSPGMPSYDGMAGMAAATSPPSELDDPTTPSNNPTNAWSQGAASTSGGAGASRPSAAQGAGTQRGGFLAFQAARHQEAARHQGAQGQQQPDSAKT